MKELKEYFQKLRFDENHHLGLGDIRLTISQQDEIVEMVGKNLKPALLAAGKVALQARLVTTANGKNLSERIEHLEIALDVYDKEILLLIGD